MKKKQFKYMVVWGGESTYVVAPSPLEACQMAADEFNVRWQNVISEMDVVTLYEVKKHG